MKRRIALVITDLDNTLYDWVGFFTKAFGAMVHDLSRLLQVPESVLFQEFQALHREYGDTEAPFVALDLPAVRARFPTLSRMEIRMELAGPLRTFNRIRAQHLKLYPGVESGLKALRAANIPVVGHTEASAVNALHRLGMLNAIQYFKHVFALKSQGPGHPDPDRASATSEIPGVVRRLPPEERKPNPRLLRDICEQEGVAPEQALYVGDSLAKDVAMARAAGVCAVWARYGTEIDRSHWEVLRQVTHWTDEDVAREAQLKRQAEKVQPDFILDRFDDVMQLLQ